MIEAIEKRVEFDASPERVWRALTLGEELCCWFPNESAFTMSAGEEGTFVWTDHGAYLARVERFDPPHSLAWRWVHKPEMDLETGTTTLVEFQLTERPDGGTILDLRESGFIRREDRRDNDGGWDAELSELVVHLERFA